MKARVPAPKERVLLYGISEESERGQAIRKTISAFGMETKTISEDMLGQTVGWCAELPGFPMAEKEAAEPPEAPGAQEASGSRAGWSESAWMSFWRLFRRRICR